MSNLIKTIRWKIRSWFLLRLPSCREMVPVMSQSLDRSLTFRERFEMKLHIFICAWCERYMKQIDQMRKAIRLKAESDAKDETHSSSALSDDARERLKQALKQNTNN